MDPAAVAADLPVLLVLALYIASDELLGWLGRYAEAGGHLVLGPRTAYADEEAAARLQVKPALLAQAAGVSYQEFGNLTSPVPVRSAGSDLELPAGTHGTGWVDALTASGAQVLAEYEHPHHGRHPAVTTARSGSGRVTVVGTVPDVALGRALARWLVPVGDDAWRALVSGSVTVSSATSGAGRRLRFVHNWSWEPTTVTVPTAVRDALGGTTSAAGGDIELGPWDVRVLIEE